MSPVDSSRLNGLLLRFAQILIPRIPYYLITDGTQNELPRNYKNVLVFGVFTSFRRVQSEIK